MEHLIHLNLTTAAFLPRIHTALERLRAQGRFRSAADRSDLVGRYLRWQMEPPVRFRIPTTASFEPSPTDGGPAEDEDPEAVLERFLSGQASLGQLVDAGTGLDLTSERVASPFSRRVTYNLYSALRMIPAHERRHLWNAQRSLDRRPDR